MGRKGRGCPFCIVAPKEGRASRKVADLSEWWSGQGSVKLLDPRDLATAKDGTYVVKTDLGTR